MMGSPASEPFRQANEGPQQTIAILESFAVSKYPVTFAEWDACVSFGGCPALEDGGFGRGIKPVVNVTWDEAKQYANWLAVMTGKPYRLLTESEWNTPPVPTPPRHTGGGRTSASITLTAISAAVAGTIGKHPLLALSSLMPSAFSICTATSGNGCKRRSKNPSVKQPSWSVAPE
jgi:hypothetical protein